MSLLQSFLSLRSSRDYWSFGRKFTARRRWCFWTSSKKSWTLSIRPSSSKSWFLCLRSWRNACQARIFRLVSTSHRHCMMRLIYGVRFGSEEKNVFNLLLLVSWRSKLFWLMSFSHQFFKQLSVFRPVRKEISTLRIFKFCLTHFITGFQINFF